MSRYICVHGHFYQPPRENPWLEIVETQESAAPWHDWNERITSECYRRNTASRILDDEGNIWKICNNYSRMSFNMGPTLLTWMKEAAPLCYAGILEADALGRKRFSGHGPALAQVYSHLIMPLANRRDKVTQVKWGIEDFRSRFGRMPEGMWLAETAVDTETLEILAENGILFTILAPRQAAEVRPLADTDAPWQSVRDEKIDTSRAYRCDLPSGKSIALFFYDGVLSQGIAFGGMLNDGGYFARRLIEAQPDRGRERDTLSHVATDGESYGHHHDHGDMALAYCLETIDSGSEAKLTIYGEFLEKNPPEYAVRIVENSSWSCVHGVERWRSDCGCSIGTPGYHQKWRAPLREALDWLRDKLVLLFEHEAAKYLKNPWEARNDYIHVILNRSRENVDDWINAHSTHVLSKEEKIRTLKLLGVQRAALLMYTSCGWFFDEISGLETKQILRYAARAICLIGELTGLDYNPEFSRHLSKAPSNIPELRNGARIYDILIKSSQVSFERLAGQCGMMSLFPRYPQEEILKNYWDITPDIVANISQSGDKNSRIFMAGEVKVASKFTREEKDFIFAANYRGNTSIVCGVTAATEENRKKTLGNIEELRSLFVRSDDEKLIEIFGHNLFSLRHILSGIRKTFLERLLQQDLMEIENGLRHIVEDYSRLIESLTALDVKAPSIIRSSASVVLTTDVIRSLEGEIPDIDTARRYLERARQWNITLDSDQISFTLSRWLLQQMELILKSPVNSAVIDRIIDVLTLFMDEFNWHLSLYEAQNLYYATQRIHGEALLNQSRALRASFRNLGKRLKFSEEALL
ncbi:MAG: DUF3536 domain-containing protein [Synergistaceae bacterium]|jgi:alpha-amylase/alpha-mannosidase (GH57 family)|nr:DUF3536 domain-containing protein [Synergistaceae bacterium]